MPNTHALAVMKTTGTVFLIVLTVVLLAIPAQHLHAGVRKWRTYRNTQLFQFVEGGAYFYVTGRMTIDADGAPNAYHPDNTGLDHLKHAGYPGTSWWKNVLVTDPEDPGKPYIVPEGRYRGYYLSMTSLRDMTKAPTDPSRYVDASRVPYLVFPSTFSRLKGVGGLGDIGVAVNLDTGAYSPFIIADIGPEQHPLGEVSIHLAQRLGGRNVCPRTGPEKPLGEILYIVFPGSGERFPWPGCERNIDRIAEELLVTIGGAERIVAWIGHGSDMALRNRPDPDKT